MRITKYQYKDHMLKYITENKVKKKWKDVFVQVCVRFSDHNKRVCLIVFETILLLRELRLTRIYSLWHHSMQNVWQCQMKINHEQQTFNDILHDVLSIYLCALLLLQRKCCAKAFQPIISTVASTATVASTQFQVRPLWFDSNEIFTYVNASTAHVHCLSTNRTNLHCNIHSSPRDRLIVCILILTFYVSQELFDTCMSVWWLNTYTIYKRVDVNICC